MTQLHGETARTIAELCAVDGVEHFDRPCTSVVAIARNQCVARALELSADYLLFVDSDVSSSSPRDDLYALISTGRSIVCGAYKMRGKEQHATAFCSTGWASCHGTGTIEAVMVGAGFLLVSREAMLSIGPDPFRPWVIDESGNPQIATEDVGFCVHAKQKGIDSFLCYDTHLTHHI